MSQFLDFFLSLNGSVVFASGLVICLVWDFLDRNKTDKAAKELDRSAKDDPYKVFRSL